MAMQDGAMAADALGAGGPDAGSDADSGSDTFELPADPKFDSYKVGDTITLEVTGKSEGGGLQVELAEAGGADEGDGYDDLRKHMAGSDTDTGGQ